MFGNPRGNSSMDELYQYYPGDEYVDWFAYSQFAQGVARL